MSIFIISGFQKRLLPAGGNNMQPLLRGWWSPSRWAWQVSAWLRCCSRWGSFLAAPVGSLVDLGCPGIIWLDPSWLLCSARAGAPPRAVQPLFLGRDTVAESWACSLASAGGTHRLEHLQDCRGHGNQLQQFHPLLSQPKPAPSPWLSTPSRPQHGLVLGWLSAAPGVASAPSALICEALKDYSDIYQGSQVTWLLCCAKVVFWENLRSHSPIHPVSK